jgi:hypothetical protein
MDVASAFVEWWSDLRAARSYAALPLSEREALARDAGVTEDTLGRIVGRGAGAELGRLLEAVYLDAAELRRKHPDVMRDMQVACSMCPVAGRCRSDLERGVSRLTFHNYCPNTETIAALEGRTWWRDLVRA